MTVLGYPTFPFEGPLELWGASWIVAPRPIAVYVSLTIGSLILRAMSGQSNQALMIPIELSFLSASLTVPQALSVPTSALDSFVAAHWQIASILAFVATAVWMVIVEHVALQLAGSSKRGARFGPVLQTPTPLLLSLALFIMISLFWFGRTNPLPV